MIPPRHARRLLHISRVLVRYRLDEIVRATHLYRPVRLLRFFTRTPRAVAAEPRAVRVRMALEELGPIFVKFGQVLSTRRDLLPLDIADELARLQDRVRPFPGEEAKAMIEHTLRRPVAELYTRFDEVPMASASIAQVHAATLASGDDVVVKVLRPGVERDIRRDVELLKLVARLAERYAPESRRLRPREVVGEFEKTIYDELDMQREGANYSQLRRNFEGSRLLYVPRVYWSHTRDDVLTLERIYGVPISDIPGLKAAGADLKLLAEYGVEIFYTQVFRDNFFHADMHPGNILVDVSDPSDPSYIALDLGIVGTLTEADQRYLAENFMAFFDQDYRRVAELHVESGWVPEGTRVDEFESAIRTVCEPNFAKPLSEISFGEVLLKLFRVARRFNMEVQPQLVLLQKTLLNIEGLGRELYPDLDLWTTARPVLERILREKRGPANRFREARKNLPRWLATAPEFPDLIHGYLRKAVHGELTWRLDAASLAPLREELRAEGRRRLQGLAGSVIGLGGLLWYLFGPPGEFGIVPGAAAGALGAILLWRAWRA